MAENKVFASKSSRKIISDENLARAANEISIKLQPCDIPERLSGQHCSCPNGGEFVLLPLNHRMVKSGGKRYMRCRICGEYSHL